MIFMIGDFVNQVGRTEPYIYLGRILLVDNNTGNETVFNNITDLINFLDKGKKDYRWLKKQVYNYIDKNKLFNHQYYIKSMIGGKLIPYKLFIKKLKERIEYDYTVNKLSIFALMQKYKVSCYFIFKNTKIEACDTFEEFFNKNVFIMVKSEDVEYVFTNLTDFSKYCMKHNIGVTMKDTSRCRVLPRTVLNNIVLNKIYKQHNCHINIYEM